MERVDLCAQACKAPAAVLLRREERSHLRAHVPHRLHITPAAQCLLQLGRMLLYELRGQAGKFLEVRCTRGYELLLPNFKWRMPPCFGPSRVHCHAADSGRARAATPIVTTAPLALALQRGGWRPLVTRLNGA